MIILSKYIFGSILLRYKILLLPYKYKRDRLAGKLLWKPARGRFFSMCLLRQCLGLSPVFLLPSVRNITLRLFLVCSRTLSGTLSGQGLLRRGFRGLTHGQKFVIWMIIPVKKLRMLITIMNSNSSPEVNSSEVSLKSQCKFCVWTQKHPNIFWEAELTWPLCLCTHMFIYEFVPPLENSHSTYELQICNHHYNDHSSYKFSLSCVTALNITKYLI